MDKRLADRLGTGLLWAAMALILAILAWFLLHILGQGLPHLTPDFLFGLPSQISAGGGVGPFLFNSFYILTLSLVFSVPVGMGAGIWLAEYARPGRFTDLIRLSTEALATVPSIVLGLFGMLIFVQWLGLGFTILGGALALGLLNLPVLVNVTEAAIRSVPDSYREASLALGATRFQTVTRVVLPAALPGLVTGITLVAGRALGETAILVFTAGTTASRFFPDFDPLASGATLAVHLWATGSNPIVPDADRIQAGAAALLVLMVLAFNLAVALPARAWYRRRTGSLPS
ncbi:phosphate ABC transporter permease PstA [Caldinitratiruptor microaerophilus]|uniref:Phosphate transport system permease protein PstA n=1 Tax=Caldinitratiruptor microaerophilus TaxID=671077 RepID=A0AA35G5B1_9FIRM|nr:phosphate ABC transporter permease PstA [Caldinitratiruptor microaerophilus]BDG59071.1 phosphate transport system permease protein PstA [Caldinitratiruptor microaerophilus]